MNVNVELIDAFDAFRDDAVESVRIQVRRKRAADLRHWFSTTERIDPETFTCEVWRLECQTLFDGTDITGELWNDSLSPDRAAELAEGLTSGRLELHGNYVWGSGSNVYGPTLSNPDEKQRYIRQALEIVQDADLDPIVKAERIDAIPGFGPNCATGLVMLLHPHDFAIRNAASIDAFKKLGLDTAPLASFQAAARELKQRLGAEDFLELDWFLFNLHRGRINLAQSVSWWWVNQGRTYERELEARCLWAPLQGRDGRVVPHHTNMAQLQPGDQILHYSEGALKAVGRVVAPIQQAPRPYHVRGELPERQGYLAPVTYHPLDPPIPIDEISLESRQALSDGPFTRTGAVKQGYLFPITAEFVADIADRFPDCWPREARVRYVWLFQAVPELYDLAENLVGTMVGDEDDWLVTRYRDEIQPGDIVLLWQAGPAAGIYAVGEVTGPCFQRPANFAAKGDTQQSAKEWAVPFRYTKILDAPILKATLQTHDALRGLQVLRAPQGTNFRVTKEEWLALEKLLEHPVPPYAPPPFTSIVAAIKREGLRLDARTVRRYHLALQTRGFVILAGVSGSGKTWLSEAYARAVGAEHLLVPVAPNWTTNEDLLGFYNPLDNLYHHTPFSRFLQRAAAEYTRAESEGRAARPFHVTLDELNLARVEHYFARFLSAMEVRMRQGVASIELGPDGSSVPLTRNLYVIGTVNVDETTYGFADKVYDRSQLIELDIAREAMRTHIGDVPYHDLLFQIWDVMRPVAPFGFRVVDEIKRYVAAAEAESIEWADALDEQLLQKVLPKCRGTDLRLDKALQDFIELTDAICPLSAAKAIRMREDFQQHGFVSYF